MGANMGGSQKRLFAFLCKYECSSMHMNRWETGVEFASTGDEKKPIRGRTEERQERAQPKKRATHVTSKNKKAHPSAQLQSHAHPKVDSGVRDWDPAYYLTKLCN